jgi:hypothetical protein
VLKLLSNFKAILPLDKKDKQNLIRNLQGKKPFDKPKRRGIDTDKTNLGEVRCECIV